MCQATLVLSESFLSNIIPLWLGLYTQFNTAFIYLIPTFILFNTVPIAVERKLINGKVQA